MLLSLRFSLSPAIHSVVNVRLTEEKFLLELLQGADHIVDVIVNIYQSG